MSATIVRTIKKKRNWWEPKQTKEKKKVEFYPAPGTRFFQFKGKKMWAF